jgi:hypothetical protein
MVLSSNCYCQNDDLVGATASSIFNGTKIRITANSAAGIDSKLEVQSGGTALGSTKLDFTTDEVTGVERDYVLNRFNGQIRLTDELVLNLIRKNCSRRKRLSKAIEFY